MNYQRTSSLGLAHLILQFLFTLIIDIVLSIFTLTVQAFVMLFVRSAANAEHLKISHNSYHVPHCSICQRHSLSNANAQSTDSPIT